MDEERQPAEKGREHLLADQPSTREAIVRAEITPADFRNDPPDSLTCASILG